MEGYKKNEFEELFRRFKGQPVEILTEDGVRYCGIDLNANDESVEIIDKCSRVIFIPYAHICAVVEPKMRLNHFCGDDDCDCKGRKEHDECND